MEHVERAVRVFFVFFFHPFGSWHQRVKFGAWAPEPATWHRWVPVFGPLEGFLGVDIGHVM